MSTPAGPSQPSRPGPSHSSRRRYDEFVDDYRHRRLDQKVDEKPSGAGASPKPESKGLLTGARRASLREYARWLKPHRVAIGWFVVLSLVVAGLQMIEPLFMQIGRAHV